MTVTALTDIRSRIVAATRRFFALPLWRDYRTLAVLWLLLAVIATLTKGGLDCHHNNFRIFRAVFLHLRDGVPLYGYYPEEYFDHNLYGPVFGVIIAPFALVPPFWGLLLWNVALAASLFAAIAKSPLPKGAKIFTMWFVSNEVLGALFMAQFNIAICALMVAAFTAMRHRRACLFALCVAVGTMTKLYGMMALSLLPFIPCKWRAGGWTVVWMAILFVAPMAIGGVDFTMEQWRDWLPTLADKNALNAEALHQNISFIGMSHRVSGAEFSDLFILVPAALLFLLPAVRTGQYRHEAFQWATLASALMVIILFSTGSESSGYIIACTGVALWYVTAPWERSRADVWLLIFVLVLSSFGNSDLMPRALRRGLIMPYSLKALPVTIVWLKLIWEMCTRSYAPTPQGGEGN